jgi:hypothetical protein
VRSSPYIKTPLNLATKVTTLIVWRSFGTPLKSQHITTRYNKCEVSKLISAIVVSGTSWHFLVWQLVRYSAWRMRLFNYHHSNLSLSHCLRFLTEVAQ